MARRKIAIVGAGIGGMATAFELSGRPGWRDEYEISVYQLGWRLGGQGATGRNPRYHQRIEEHGLHFWGGFYENAFQVMRRCYEELGRKPGEPLATVWEAFQPQSFWTVEEYLDGRWSHWPHPFPTDDRLPGDGHALTPWQITKLAIEELIGLVEGGAHSPFSHEAQHRVLPVWLTSVVHGFGSFIGRVKAEVGPGGSVTIISPPLGSGAGSGVENVVEAAPSPEVSHPENGFLRLALDLAQAAHPDTEAHPEELHRAIAWFLKEFRTWFLHNLEPLWSKFTETRRLYIVTDLMVAAIAGALEDRALSDGVGILDEYDLIEWLRKHGASERSLGSAMIRGYYDYFFSYECGDITRPRLGTGTALWHMARLLLDYKGAVWWKMVGGMGDTVFGPLYEVLKRRGVAIHFFHRADALHPSADGKSVDSIDFQVQATLKDPAQGYKPLYDVKGLPCWPNEPFYDQLDEGDALRDKKINLEDPWADWSGVGKITLKRGEHFDDVVLATSMAPMAGITSELMNINENWRLMVERVATVQTLAFQLGLKPTMAQMGWTLPNPLLSAYAQPLNTGSDMSHVLPHEDWPQGDTPGTVLYFCGPLQDAQPIPELSDHDFPRREKERVRQITLQWLIDNIAPLLPKATIPINPTGLDWSLLADTDEAQGAARLDAQYYRANVGSTQRYVLTVPGSTAYRMKQGKSPFDNLYLAGDFVFTMLGGCVEGAAMAGRMAARAISGHPEVIPGEVTS